MEIYIFWDIMQLTDYVGEYAASIFRVEEQTRQTDMKQAESKLVSYLDIPWSLLKAIQHFRGTCLLRKSLTIKRTSQLHVPADRTVHSHQ
jgi:hypothetical protein